MDPTASAPLRLRGLHAQLGAHHVERGRHGLVHVVVLVAAQATGEHHAALARSQLSVLLVQRGVARVVDGVVRLVARLPVGRVLTRDDRGGLLTELEVLVLDDARVRHVSLGVVHHGHALVVGLVELLGLKAQRAVLERAQLVVVERVDGAAVYHAVRDVGLGCHELGVLHAAADLGALEHVLNHLGVTAHGDALVAVVEVVVVVGEAARQAADDARRQLGAIAAPLLLGVALHELLEDVATHERERLLLEVGRLADALGGDLLIDFGARVGGRHHAGPHLGEGVHVERHVVHLALVIGYGRVDIVVELGEVVHIVPHVAHGGVEDVRAVHVHVDAVDVLGVDVAGHMIATVDDQAGLAGAARLVGKDRAGDAGANNEVILLGHGG